MDDKLYKTIGERATALMIDHFLLPFIASIIGFIFGYFSEYSVWIFMLYRVIMHSLYGQTIGKKILHIKVVDVRTNQKLKINKVLLREITPSLIFFLIYSHRYFERLNYDNRYEWVVKLMGISGMALLIAEVIILFLNKRKRTLHDFISNSAVVDLGVLEPVKIADNPINKWWNYIYSGNNGSNKKRG